MRIFKNKVFSRYARKQGISDSVLAAAISEIESGLIDADYGGHLVKKRIARQGGGKSGGHRTILAYVKGDKAFFMFGFAKNDRDNIDRDEVRDFKKLATLYIGLDEDELKLAQDQAVLFEVKQDEEDL